MQPCWTCKKYAGGCSWSARYEPVPGWTATPTRKAASKKSASSCIESYDITYCPEYEKDREFEPVKREYKYDIKKFKVLVQEGLSDQQIQRRMGGMPIRMVKHYRNIVRPKKPKKEGLLKRTLPEHKEQQRMMLYQRGLKDLEIAKQTGVKKSTIRKWRERRGLKKNE